ncbi:uncharacterized protein LOC128991185 isoform X1 [Macrosteles quadrilineatus]|uniref:uncharacterized protein LOC128991185 isoform X1 n=1 Tax=Macrosteles quadrilineatus TaxID=74068 RepID=UPI0023E148E6|nr:uncharacterized protein LOC128991185 isoform X1 [Macrosteles quadrilineatus]
MRQLSTLLSVVFISTAVSHSIEKRESNEKRVVCYYTNWSVYRPGTAKYNPQNINPYLCTHLIYAFGGLDRENGLRPYDKYQDIEQGGYAKFTGLKSYNKNLKTMLAIGGWNEGSARFSPLVADDERRKEFVKNVVKFLRVNHFDGLDLDWEYPAFRDGGKPRDRDNYAQLVQELREEFDREHEKTGRPRLLLTMAVPAGIEYIDKGYDVPKLNRYLDFMNILSYDYHSAFEPAVNHHSPLFPLEEDNEYNFDAQLSIDYTVKHYLKLGADRDKLVLGIPTYGRSYTLFNPDSTDIGAPADGPGEQGDATREKGYLAYYEICQALKDEDDWTVVQPKPGAMGPYAFKNNQWVGYDDMDIAKKKSQYVNDQSLGGIMFWSIDNDDFRGKCHDRAYPLIEAAKEALYASSGTSNNVVSSSNKKEKTSGFTTPNRRVTKPSKSPPKVSRTTTTTPSPPSKGLTTPEPPTTPDPGSDFVCKDEGFFPHPRDCKKYFWCLDSGPSNLGIVAHQFTCPSGLFFNKAADSCDYTRNVLCNKKDKSEKTTTAAPKTTASTTKSSGSKIITTTTTTTTTTTEAPIPEEEYEEEEEEHEQEDPEAIKQLIQLIKKLGGVAELEKQLEGAGASGVSTPAIPRSLYKKVLTPQRPRYQSPYRNGPSGPQNEGLAKEDDGSSYRRDKPQYVTIRRERPSTEAPEEEKVEVVTPSSRYKYTSIIRNRPPQYEVKESTEEEEEEPVVRAGPTTPRYQTIERSRPAQPIKEDEEEEERFKPKYSSIQRNRPTTVEAFIESTTPRYVTLRRQRPQSEQQQEESTIKHTGETIVIEQEEEIKPIEIDVEEPIPTSVRPKIKVSEGKPNVEQMDATAEPSENNTETPTTATTEASTVFIVTPEPNTIYTEAKTSTEPISTKPTTVPYQTSTLTSIVTVVVEGATERRRVPVKNLKQALADHDLLANTVSADKKPVEGKSSVIESTKEIDLEDKVEEKNRFRPIGNYRGRPRKPIVIEPPTTKALPLYLQRRRTTTVAPDVSSETEETQTSTKAKQFGRFTPRNRERVRERPSSTEPIAVEEPESSTPRANRYRTSRPTTAGSRFTFRGRTRSTTEKPEVEDGLEENKTRNKFGSKDELTDNNSKKRKSYGNKASTESDYTEISSEKPTRLFTRGRLRTTTTEKASTPLDDDVATPKSSSRSRFVISRGRNRESSSLSTRPLQSTTEQNFELKSTTSLFNTGGSRFQIQRRRKPKNETESVSQKTTLDQQSTTEDSSVRSTSSEEEKHEIMISQENASVKPGQLSISYNSTTVSNNTNDLVSILNLDNSTSTPSVSKILNETRINQEENNNTLPNVTLATTESTSEIVSADAVTKNESVTTESILLKGVFLNNTKAEIDSQNQSLAANTSNDNDTFDDNQSDGEVLNVIASRYNEQSFTGRRGSVRFQGAPVTEDVLGNSILEKEKKVVTAPSRRRKIESQRSEKNLSTSKSAEDTEKSSRRRKVLVRKNKPNNTEKVTETSTETARRNRVIEDRNNNRVRSRGFSTQKPELEESSKKQSRILPNRQRNDNEDSLGLVSEHELTRVNYSGKDEEVEGKDNRRRKVKVLKSINQINTLDSTDNTSGKRKVMVIRKKVKTDSDGERVPTQSRRGSNRFPERDLSDLDTGTSLYVQRETDGEFDVSRGSFPRSVKGQPSENSLTGRDTRGKVKAFESLFDDIVGVTDVNEEATDVPDEVGTNRVRVGFRRPVTPSTLRSRSSTTTESNLVSERPTAKFLRRRVQSKFRPESRNTTAFVSTAATSPAPDLYETTAKQRRFEFPRRSSKVNINSLPQQAALVGTSAPFVEIQDNHSDESLHEVDTERLENQESLEGDLQGLGVEDATLPDLANVAVVAIQSLATAPPSTETFAPVTVTNRRRVSRPSTTTTTTTPQPTVAVRRGPPRPFSKVRPGPTTIAPKSQFITRHKPYDDLAPDYEDYYAEPVEIPLSGKVRIHNDGYIECLDIGNFPHPFACKKFISCAKMENEHLLGWEYTCPRGLSFDPIGGICNWSAGLGCKE